MAPRKSTTQKGATSKAGKAPRTSKDQANGKASAKGTRGRAKPKAAPPTKETGPVFFFGADRDNGFLSNMAISQYEEAGEIFNCPEQFFQAAKAELFGDSATRTKIMKEKDPKAQKALGKKVKGFDEDQWRKYRYNVMLKANYLKFTQSPRSKVLRQQLQDTDDREICEASKDDVWAIGMTVGPARTYKSEGWPGTNLQGHILMAVRSATRGGKLDEEEPAFEDVDVPKEDE